MRKFLAALVALTVLSAAGIAAASTVTTRTEKTTTTVTHPSKGHTLKTVTHIITIENVTTNTVPGPTVYTPGPTVYVVVGSSVPACQTAENDWAAWLAQGTYQGSFATYQQWEADNTTCQDALYPGLDQ